MKKKKLVILGAGFAGLQLARRIKGSEYDVILIDQYNFHQFQPLFYQVATGRLEPSSISFPLRKVFQNTKSVSVRVASVEQVKLTEQEIVTSGGVFTYDYLVIATGGTSNFFGNKNIEQYAFPMKSTTEAIALRNRILLNYEEALYASDKELKRIMNIVIVGGGPTGVELAGALAEMKKKVLPKDYPDMDFSKLNIYLVEGSPHTLNSMSTISKETSQKYLVSMGVNLILKTFVKDYDGRIAELSNGEKIETHTLIWAAGIRGNVPNGITDDLLVKGNRIKVDQYNRVNGLSNVFALGDIAYMEDAMWPNGHPQLANVAISQAKNLSSNFKRIAKGRSLKVFKYKNPGTMATIGKRKAVVDLPTFSFQGFTAWMFWMFLHLMLIVSVKNRLIIFINWAISYITNDTTLRLILLPTRKQIELVNTEKYKI